MSCAIESRQFVLFWVIPDFDSLGGVAIDIAGSHPWGAPTQGRAPDFTRRPSIIPECLLAFFRRNIAESEFVLCTRSIFNTTAKYHYSHIPTKLDLGELRVSAVARRPNHLQ